MRARGRKKVVMAKKAGFLRGDAPIDGILGGCCVTPIMVTPLEPHIETFRQSRYENFAPFAYNMK
jgi:hypothetical protein